MQGGVSHCAGDTCSSCLHHASQACSVHAAAQCPDLMLRRGCRLEEHGHGRWLDAPLLPIGLARCSRTPAAAAIGAAGCHCCCRAVLRHLKAGRRAGGAPGIQSPLLCCTRCQCCACALAMQWRPCGSRMHSGSHVGMQLVSEGGKDHQTARALTIAALLNLR